MLLKLQMEASHPRHTTIQTLKEDHKCLSPKGWLNDSLIDLWVQWITRMEYQLDSSIHTFTTHFYVKLEDESVNSVLSWTANKGIEMLSKKFIYVPLHREWHWPLIIVVNLGLIDVCDECNNIIECPCVLHLDG
jgi:Ulp1 family protease